MYDNVEYMIKIDLVNFTPFSSFIGGIMIGLAVIIFFISTGRLAGVSGIANNVIFKSLNRSINILFILGLVGIASIIWYCIPLDFEK